MSLIRLHTIDSRTLPSAGITTPDPAPCSIPRAPRFSLILVSKDPPPRSNIPLPSFFQERERDSFGCFFLFFLLFTRNFITFEKHLLYHYLSRTSLDLSFYPPFRTSRFEIVQHKIEQQHARNFPFGPVIRSKSIRLTQRDSTRSTSSKRPLSLSLSFKKDRQKKRQREKERALALTFRGGESAVPISQSRGRPCHVGAERTAAGREGAEDGARTRARDFRIRSTTARETQVGRSARYRFEGRRGPIVRHRVAARASREWPRGEKRKGSPRVAPPAAGGGKSLSLSVSKRWTTTTTITTTIAAAVSSWPLPRPPSSATTAATRADDATIGITSSPSTFARERRYQLSSAAPSLLLFHAVPTPHPIPHRGYVGLRSTNGLPPLRRDASSDDSLAENQLALGFARISLFFDTFFLLASYSSFLF